MEPELLSLLCDYKNNFICFFIHRHSFEMERRQNAQKCVKVVLENALQVNWLDV